MKKTERGVTICQQVAEQLNHILEKARETDQLVGQIAEASSEQTRGVEQVNQAVGRMDEITQQTASSAQESAAASQELKTQSMDMSKWVISLLAFVNRQTSQRTFDDESTQEPHATPPPRPYVNGSDTPALNGARHRYETTVTASSSRF